MSVLPRHPGVGLWGAYAILATAVLILGALGLHHCNTDSPRSADSVDQTHGTSDAPELAAGRAPTRHGESPQIAPLDAKVIDTLLLQLSQSSRLPAARDALLTQIVGLLSSDPALVRSALLRAWRAAVREDNLASAEGILMLASRVADIGLFAEILQVYLDIGSPHSNADSARILDRLTRSLLSFTSDSRFAGFMSSLRWNRPAGIAVLATLASLDRERASTAVRRELERVQAASRGATLVLATLALARYASDDPDHLEKILVLLQNHGSLEKGERTSVVRVASSVLPANAAASVLLMQVTAGENQIGEWDVRDALALAFGAEMDAEAGHQLVVPLLQAVSLAPDARSRHALTAAIHILRYANPSPEVRHLIRDLLAAPPMTGGDAYEVAWRANLVEAFPDPQVGSGDLIALCQSALASKDWGVLAAHLASILHDKSGYFQGSSVQRELGVVLRDILVTAYDGARYAVYEKTVHVIGEFGLPVSDFDSLLENLAARLADDPLRDYCLRLLGR